jgi:hypothetical protein
VRNGKRKDRNNNMLDKPTLKKKNKMMKRIIMDTIKDADIQSVVYSVEFMDGPTNRKIDSGIRELSIKYKARPPIY